MKHEAIFSVKPSFATREKRSQNENEEAARKFFGSPLFQPLDDILHPLPVIFKADFSISVIERADFSHDPLQIHLLLACLPDVHWGGGTNISSGGGR